MISLENVSKVYRRGIEQVHALDGVTLDISAGDYVAICGPSGSGKTTLLNIAGCMDQPTGGVVRVAGEDIQKAGERRLARVRQSLIGFVFQQFFLIPTLTVRENVELPLLFSHRKPDPDRTAELLRIVGLEHRLRHRPGQLSGGEMQRVAVARSLINQPKVILADEPTGNLDSRNSAAVVELFEAVNRQGIAVVLVTHNPVLAARCAKVVHLEDGKVV
ncbi:MAG: ABC transporter ATP-binding protein [Opitutae bacterium]|nr:ABC transporter ATP-binding protein [Opitutae bacterium]